MRSNNTAAMSLTAVESGALHCLQPLIALLLCKFVRALPRLPTQAGRVRADGQRPEGVVTPRADVHQLDALHVRVEMARLPRPDAAAAAAAAAS